MGSEVVQIKKENPSKEKSITRHEIMISGMTNYISEFTESNEIEKTESSCYRGLDYSLSQSDLG